LLASARTSSCTRSRMLNRLMSDMSMLLLPGARNSGKLGGSGATMYCVGSDRNAVVSEIRVQHLLRDRIDPIS